jgi:hypothetical protein
MNYYLVSAAVRGFPFERTSQTVIPTSVTPSASTLKATTLDLSQDSSTTERGMQTTVADGDGDSSNTNRASHSSSTASDSDIYTTHAGSDTTVKSTHSTTTANTTAASSPDTTAASSPHTTTVTGTKSTQEDTGLADDVTISTTTPSPQPEARHIFEPCGAPLIVSENPIPLDQLPNIVAIIKELSQTAVYIRDFIVSTCLIYILIYISNK